MPSASVPSDGRYNPGPVQEKEDKLGSGDVFIDIRHYRDVSRWCSLFLYCDKLFYKLWCEDASITILNVYEHLLYEYEMQYSNLQPSEYQWNLNCNHCFTKENCFLKLTYH